MNLWKQTDRLFLSDENRRLRTLRFLVWAYWSWQCMWLGVLFLQMTGADSYEGLFSLQNVLDQWNGSFLVRLLFSWIQGGSGWTCSLGVSDFLFLAMTVLSFCAGCTKRAILWALSFFMVLIFAGLMAVSCYQAGSLLDAAFRLRMTGLVGSAFILVFFASSAYFMVRQIL